MIFSLIITTFKAGEIYIYNAYFNTVTTKYCVVCYYVTSGNISTSPNSLFLLPKFYLPIKIKQCNKNK